MELTRETLLFFLEKKGATSISVHDLKETHEVWSTIDAPWGWYPVRFAYASSGRGRWRTRPGLVAPNGAWHPIRGTKVLARETKRRGRYDTE